jgi:hypothetical protein
MAHHQPTNQPTNQPHNQPHNQPTNQTNQLHPPKQEGFHDLRAATEARYLEYRRDHFAKEEAARSATAARRAQRTRR